MKAAKARYCGCLHENEHYCFAGGRQTGVFVFLDPNNKALVSRSGTPSCVRFMKQQQQQQHLV